jgi:hypothetical protein
MMKLVFTYLFLCAEGGKPTNNDEIGILFPVLVCCGTANLRIMMKLGFTYLFLCAVGRQTYE